MEKDVTYYENVMLNNERFTCHYSKSQYYSMWVKTFEWIDREDTIVDIGCGPGQYAHLLFDSGFTKYTGFDFSQKLLDKAKEVSGQKVFIQGDINELDYFYPGIDVFIILEVLEHIEKDIELIQKIPSGKKIIASVPSFGNESEQSHIRSFKAAIQVRKRYAEYIDIKEIVRFDHGSNYWFLFMGEKR